jgi:hypothetical protein
LIYLRRVLKKYYFVSICFITLQKRVHLVKVLHFFLRCLGGWFWAFLHKDWNILIILKGLQCQVSGLGDFWLDLNVLLDGYIGDLWSIELVLMISKRLNHLFWTLVGLDQRGSRCLWLRLSRLAGELNWSELTLLLGGLVFGVCRLIDSSEVRFLAFQPLRTVFICFWRFIGSLL